MQFIVPFVVFVICVVVLFLVAGKIAFGGEEPFKSNRSLIYISFRESDSLLKRIALWGLVVVGIIIFLMTYLFLLSFLVKTGFVFRGLMALVSMVIVYAFAECLTKSIWKRCTLSFLITFTWFVWPNWVTLDIAAVCMTIVFLVNSKDVTVRSIAIISCIVMIYDVVSVFGTGVMQKVASGVLGSVPMLFIVPKHFAWVSERAFALGLGDVVIPGIIIMIALREAKNYTNTKIGWMTILGYVVGCVLTFMVVVIFKTPQPATIYLIPCTFLFLWFAVEGTPLRDKFLGELGGKPILPIVQQG